MCHGRCGFWQHGRWCGRRLKFRCGFCRRAQGLDHRINVLGVQGRGPQEFDKGRTQQRRTVVNQIGLLPPSREIKIVPAAMVGKGQAVKVEFGHQQAGHTGQNESAASDGQEALCNAGGSEKSKANRPPPNAL